MILSGTRRRRRPRVALVLATLAILVQAAAVSADGGATAGGGAEVQGAAPANASASATLHVASSPRPATPPGTPRRVRIAAIRTPAGAAAPVNYATAYRAGARMNKVVALTFDDGYSPAETLAIFRILSADHVKATFFPYARAMLLDSSLWREIAAAGYPIGNHTYSHANLTHLSMSGAISELTRARSTIRAVTGRAEPPIMRPPYGAYTTTTRRAAALAGYSVMALWDVDTRDWSGIAASSIVSRAVIGTRGSIVLMHAGPANTPRALPAIIANYRSRGYTFVTVPELLGVPWP